MIKNIFLFFLILFCSPLDAADFSWWGKPAQNNIEGGALTWHMQDTFGDDHDEPHYLLYPFVGGTYNGINVIYFKNTYLRSTVGVSVERNLYSTSLNKNYRFDLNYKLGVLLGGYCIKSLSCEPSSPRAIPALVPAVRLVYKNKIGFSISVFGVVVAGTFQYFF